MSGPASAADAAAAIAKQAGPAAGARATLVVRPEWLELRAPGTALQDRNAFPGIVRTILYKGGTMQVVVGPANGAPSAWRDGEATVAVRNDGANDTVSPRIGDPVDVCWRITSGRLVEDS